MEGTKEGGPQKLQELQKSRISRMGYYLVVPPPPSAAFDAMGSSSSAVSVLHGWDAAAAADAASVGNQIKLVFSPSMILADPDAPRTAMPDSSAAPNRARAGNPIVALR